LASQALAGGQSWVLIKSLTEKIRLKPRFKYRQWVSTDYCIGQRAPDRWHRTTTCSISWSSDYVSRSVSYHTATEHHISTKSKKYRFQFSTQLQSRNVVIPAALCKCRLLCRRIHWHPAGRFLHIFCKPKIDSRQNTTQNRAYSASDKQFHHR